MAINWTANNHNGPISELVLSELAIPEERASEQPGSKVAIKSSRTCVVVVKLVVVLYIQTVYSDYKI